MGNQNQSRNYALGLTVLSALGRLVPHAPNVTPLGGSCLFAGSRIGGYLAYLLPLAVMIATDPIVGAAGGAHSGYSLGSPLIYASFMINVWIGRRFLRNVSTVRVGAAAFACSLQFFLISNFGTWLDYYPHTMAGLLTCYAEAIPYWGRTLAGDLLYSGALFGMYAFLSRRVAASERAVA